MKISKIYANKSEFKPIIFNDGFNVIFGDVENEINQNTGKVQEHNIGKTSLIHLIDFLLLKQVSKKNLFGKYSNKFYDWIFFIEIKLNDGKFVTIRRGISPNTKISFKEHYSANLDFKTEDNWDYENLLLNAKDKMKNPKHIFQNEYLKYDVIPEIEFRSLLPYLLRTQNDYGEVFLLSESYSHKTRKPLLFKLLGFDDNLLRKKYDIDNEIKDEEKVIKKLVKEGNPEDIYKIKAAIEAKEQEKQEVALKLNDFDFLQKEKSINFELVNNIEVDVSQRNKKAYALDYNINSIQKSLDSEAESSVNVKDIKNLFEEVNIYFAENIAKEYSDVINFSNQITKERRKYLKNELKELIEEKEINDAKLNELNLQRSSMLSLLQEKDTFSKYKTYQEDLIKIENEIFFYQKQLDGANTIENYQASLDELKGQIKKASLDIKKEIDKDNKNYQEIRNLFQSIYKTTFEYTALLIIEPNSNGNINIATSILNKTHDLTGKGDGHTSTKVLCASFILAILLHYSSKSFYRFAYHDGIMESWGDNHKRKFINLVRTHCNESNIQYIISMIKSDKPTNFEFEKGEIVRTLSKDDYLFGFEF